MKWDLRVKSKCIRRFCFVECSDLFDFSIEITCTHDCVYKTWFIELIAFKTVTNSSVDKMTMFLFSCVFLALRQMIPHTQSINNFGCGYKFSIWFHQLLKIINDSIKRIMNLTHFRPAHECRSCHNFTVLQKQDFIHFSIFPSSS